MIAPFVPMLFQGEEWGASAPFLYFTDHQSPELAQAVREGRRAEFAAFGWAPEDVPDPQDQATFALSRLDWDEREREPHASLLRWHRELVALRAAQPCLQGGGLADVRVQHAAPQRWIEVVRGPVTLLANLGGEWVERPRPAGRRVLASEANVDDTLEAVRLPPESAAVWVVD